MKFKSRFALEEIVRFAPTKEASGDAAVVIGVTFRENKCTYDLELALGGEPLINVDSAFVHPYH